MPSYTFKCDDCGKTFDQRVPYAEKEKVRCPGCGGKAHDTFAGFMGSRTGGDSTAAPVRFSGG